MSIYTNYCDSLPQEIPAALFKSAAGTAGLSVYREETVEQAVQNVFMDVGATLFHSLISAPIANHLFSNKSADFRDTSSLGISLLLLLGLCGLGGLNKENFQSNLRVSSITLGLILNAGRKPGEAVALMA